jgi:hydroxymethylpyrimidine pyrophosphatase-like HAD family hydrolase
MTMILQTNKDNLDEQSIRRIVGQFPQLDVRFWFGLSYFEIFYKTVSKGSALTQIANYYGIPKEDIIAFGDAENAIDMFAVSGISVAMKNGGPDIIKNAHRVSVKDNDNEGIYHTLKQILKEVKNRR